MPKAALVALLGISIAAGSASGGAAPSQPRVLGPRRTHDRTPTFRFVSSERGLPRRALHFRCRVDAHAFRRCGSRYTPRLAVGRHVLRVYASDPGGRRSPTARFAVTVLRPMPGARPADQTIRVGASPYNLAAGFGSVWAAVGGTLLRLDQTSGGVQARIPVGGRTWGVTVGDGAAWVGNYGDGSVVRIDPATNAVTRRFVLDGGPVGIAVGGGAVWAANNFDDRVWRLDPITGSVLHVAHVGDRHEFAGFSEGRVWVASEDGSVGELDAATGSVTRTVTAGDDADFLAFSPGSVWVSNYRTGFLWRVDAATGRIVRRIPVAGGAQGIAIDGGTVWVAFYTAALVEQVDASTGAVRRRYRVGIKPRGLVIAGGSVWVANSQSNTISRIALRG